MALQTQARLPWSARSARGRCGAALIIALAFAQSVEGAEPSPNALPLKDQPHFRGPVDAVWISADRFLAVANRCGTVSVVDTYESRVIEEVPVGKQLSSIARHPGGALWLTIDHEGHQLVELIPEGDSLRVKARHSVARYPISLAISKDGRLIAVASLWSRKVTLFAASADEGGARLRLQNAATVGLSFNPGGISFHETSPSNASLLVPDEAAIAGSSFFVVTDAFAHSSAVLSAESPFRVADRGIQVQSAVWGQRGASYSWEGRMLMPDYVYGLAAFIDGPKEQKPIPPGSETFAIANWKVPLGPAAEPSPARRGEMLFTAGNFEGRNAEFGLARETCNTCHKWGHTTYALADTVADGTKGAPKRIPTLLGTRLTDPWAWNGSFRDLNEQIRSSLKNTMHVTNFTDEQVADLAAYLHTLPPPPPLEPATDDPADREQIARGKELFGELGCGKCHVPPLTYTSPDTYDVGLEDEKGLKKFNPPSLRGVSQGYSFFHDGRAKTLEEVFTVYGHQLDRVLSDEQLADLVRFLRSL